MRGTRALALALALLAVSSSCASAKSATAPSAVHLTSDGADAEIGKMTDDAEFAAIEFFAPWCPHCQNFGPTWETVAAYFNKGEGNGGSRPSPRVTVFSVDCVAERDMCHAFHIRGYPTVLFGTLAQFKAEKEKENAGALAKLAARAARDVLDAIGKETGGSYALRSEAHTAEARATEARAKAAAAAGLKEKEGGAETKATKAREPPRADLLDVAVATARAFGEMTSPALLRPETRPAFFGFVDLLASAHPLRVCVDGARAIVDAFDELWPAEDGDMAGVRARLAEARVCGEGLDALFAKTAPTVSTSETGKAGTNAGSGSQSRDDALVRAHPWRSCAGSVEGTRGYTCGLWTLLHTLAARAPGPEGGAAWFEKTTGWIEHFFPCDDCRAHFLAMAAEVPRGEIVTARDAQLWLWRAHNEVNARLAAREARGEGAGSGDPAFPKAQWPAYAACEACREVAAGANEAVRWDEEAVAAFLTVYFHGVGAPRLELGDGKSALGAPRGDEERFAREKTAETAGKESRPAKAACFLAFAALAAYGVKTNRLSSGNARRVLLLIRGGKSSPGRISTSSDAAADRLDKVL
jgi:thiol oxidase